ncbi:glycoside hydrolase family 13 protein [Hebeloma cylindrosporum]|uniref:Glycoside hydrolase family 13 protein n=1 Tax=Hebeloma cylindrosporum TaxID=76867 RepID=A0A0C2X9H4_HEBCY|nr:glycoside hydrolase family 13 protein [Hebeloma cylindrosporum h7]
MKDIIGRWQRYKRDEDFWNTVFMENHDHPRVVSRFGNDSEKWRNKSAKLLAILQISQGGTQFIFQGQELGLKNFPGDWGIEEYKDVASQNYWNKILERRKKEGGQDDEVDMTDILDNFQKKARDHARIPMQWDSTTNAGFTTGDPWMRVNVDYETWNAKAQIDDQDSVHSFWKKALSVRKNNELLIYGDFEDLSEGHDKVFVFTRTWESMAALVLLNFSEHEETFSLPARILESTMSLVLGNYDEQGVISIAAGSEIRLRPDGPRYVLHIYGIHLTTMQFNVVFIASALIASASLAMSATITGFDGAAALEIRARDSMFALVNAEASTMLAPMARARSLVAALDVRPHLTGKLPEHTF